MNRSDALQALYDKVPKIDCKRYCQPACGPIVPVRIEMERMGLEYPMYRESDGMCAQLDTDGGCAVYEDRPLICRIWGTVRTMRCPWGCRPERYLTDKDANDLLDELLELSGDDRNKLHLQVIKGLITAAASVEGGRFIEKGDNAP